MFVGSNILCFNARKPHPPIALYVKYRCVGVYLLIFALTTLPSKNTKFCNPRKFPAIQRSWLLCKQFPSVLQLLRIIQGLLGNTFSQPWLALECSSLQTFFALLSCWVYQILPQEEEWSLREGPAQTGSTLLSSVACLEILQEVQHKQKCEVDSGTIDITLARCWGMLHCRSTVCAI